MIPQKPDIIIEELSTKILPMDMLKSFVKYPYSFFLDSGCDPNKLGRFSFLGCDPFMVFKSKRSSIRLERPDRSVEKFNSNPFEALKDIFRAYSSPGVEGIPFVSGGVGYFAYDLKDHLEKVPDTAIDDMNIPDCIMGYYDVVVAFDNLKEKCCITSTGLPEKNPVKAKRRARQRLEEFKGRLSRVSKEHKCAAGKSVKLASNFSKDSYIRAVERAKAYIKKGDIYQVNISQRFRAGLNTEPLELYSRLREYSPAPFSSYLGFGDVVIASSSPERFLMKRGSYVETRPIKGTRPRGHTSANDSLLGSELIKSQKDRAEHIMIVDLERNDLGKVCDYGTVMPTESMILEKYSNVFHLVSTISGTLKPGTMAIDCLSAAFPGGSITGAPKIRAMEIIEELEPVKRSVYTGAIGYISFAGDMDTSIAIRTIIVKSGKVFFSVGGGIVADSVPEDEYEETLHKAKGMFQALGVDTGRAAWNK